MTGSSRALYWEDFRPGLEFNSAGRTVAEADILTFAGLSGDFNPLHTDEVTASASPYGRRIAHGALVQSLMTGLIGRLGIFDGTTVALRRLDSTFRKPVYAGDTVYAAAVVEMTKELPRGSQGIVRFKTQIVNQRDEVVADGTWVILLRKRAQ